MMLFTNQTLDVMHTSIRYNFVMQMHGLLMLHPSAIHFIIQSQNNG